MVAFTLLTACALLCIAPQNKATAPSSKPGSSPSAAVTSKMTAPAAKVTPAVPLAFREMFEVTPNALKPTEKLRQLVGKRVRMTGYMADMEQSPIGGFYLCSFPVSCDESGGGIGDLPPNAVFVVVRSAAGKTIPGHTGRPLIVSGTLELGARTEPNGYVTHIRLLMDRETDLTLAERAAVKQSSSDKTTRPASKRRTGAVKDAARSTLPPGSSSKP